MCHDTNLLCYTSWNALKSQACNIFCFLGGDFFLTFSRRALDAALESIAPPLSPAGCNPYGYYGQRLISARRITYPGRVAVLLGINRDGCGSTIAITAIGDDRGLGSRSALWLIERHGGISFVGDRVSVVILHHLLGDARCENSPRLPTRARCCS